MLLDTDLVWANCFEFNFPGSDISNDAVDVSAQSQPPVTLSSFVKLQPASKHGSRVVHLQPLVLHCGVTVLVECGSHECWFMCATYLKPHACMCLLTFLVSPCLLQVAERLLALWQSANIESSILQATGMTPLGMMPTAPGPGFAVGGVDPTGVHGAGHCVRSLAGPGALMLSLVLVFQWRPCCTQVPASSSQAFIAYICLLVVLDRLLDCMDYDDVHIAPVLIYRCPTPPHLQASLRTGW
jgi:hypothetical protein